MANSVGAADAVKRMLLVEVFLSISPCLDSQHASESLI